MMLWEAFRKNYRRAEHDVVKDAIHKVTKNPIAHDTILELAKTWVLKVREQKLSPLTVEGMMHIYKLSSPEGLSMMCLAEALLRIPDDETKINFIADKLSQGDWKKDHNDGVASFLANLGLDISHKLLTSKLKSISAPLIQKSFAQAMRLMGGQFVLGQTIQDALSTSTTAIKKGYTHSFDMLGESAKTEEDAERYYESYANAIREIGEFIKKSSTKEFLLNPSISVKLSALHPRYEVFHHKRVMVELYAKISNLCVMAKEYNMPLTIDAEESERLEMSLEIVEMLLQDVRLKDWDGLGLAVQAYQKRAMSAIDILVEACRLYHRKLSVRLVKGAYWDSEIKKTQEKGLVDFPVFTQKNHTDLNYMACALKLLESTDVIYPQFATHNAYTLAYILKTAENLKVTAFEFQRLHGMGESLHNAMMTMHPSIASRIYAPVGQYKDLLAYLVRRLLENGANSSFVNKIYDDSISIESMLESPLEFSKQSKGNPHPKIKTTENLFTNRTNSKGIDMSNPVSLNATLESITVNVDDIFVLKTSDSDLKETLVRGYDAYRTWSKKSVAERAAAVERLGHLLQKNMGNLCNILTVEAGKTLNDCVAEVREAIDFCYFYASDAVRLQENATVLPGPTGEKNELIYCPRGVFVAISPWNFPLAIFLGQAIAAIVTGNAVIAKCASQTPKIATFVKKLAVEAGIPDDVFQIVVASGKSVSEILLTSEKVAGVVFTGSTETAQNIQQTLSTHHKRLLPFVAETGGLNCMVVDSSALPEQVVQDVITSSFQSAGQRCSALRLLIIQDDIADHTLQMLMGAMNELVIGDPKCVETDVGPVIDENAQKALLAYEKSMFEKQKAGDAKLIHKCKESEGFKNLVMPQAWEIKKISDLKEEIFGPILHVVRFKGDQLETLVDEINNSGYGLTFGIHSRLDTTVNYFKNNIHAGNIYINRNMIGAVVGVQPFGGEGLSGTGFKAGGPNYLLKFLHERTITRDTTASGGNATLLAEIA